mgnify:CR=1 FL=1
MAGGVTIAKSRPEYYMYEARKQLGKPLKVLDGAGIGYERYEDTGAHIVRWGRIQQDIDSLLNHFAKGA